VHRRSALFRQRHNRGVDLLLNVFEFFFLVSVLGAAAAISPYLALAMLAVVVAMAGLYLDARRRETRARKERSASRPT
jgi:hypothetical protein